MSQNNPRCMEEGQFVCAFKQYNLFVNSAEPQPEAFYCRAQHLFDDFRESPKKPNRSIGWNIFKEWVVAIILALVSMVALLRAKANKLTTVHYLIDVKNSEGVYDRRSEYIFRGLPPNSTINFFHVHRPRNVFFSLGQRTNAVYFESLWKVVSIFILKKNVKKRAAPNGLVEEYRSAWKDQCVRESESERQIQFWQPMFRWLGIQRMICIDDARHTGELRLACQREGIPALAYMHARFNEYHVGLSRPPFDRYLVWAPMWKELLERMNPEYRNTSITISGHPQLHSEKQVMRSSNPIRIMWLEETNIDYEELKAFALALNKVPNVEVVFRGKAGSGRQGVVPWEGCEHWETDHSNGLIQSLQEKEISLVLGTHSSALLESWLVGVPSVMLASSYDYAWGLVIEGKVDGCESTEELHAVIQRVVGMDEAELRRRKELVWGTQPEWNPESTKEWLKDLY